MILTSHFWINIETKLNTKLNPLKEQLKVANDQSVPLRLPETISNQ